MTAQPVMAQLDLSPTQPPPHPLQALRERLAVGTALAAPVVALSTVPALQFTYWQWISLAFGAPVLVWGAWPSHRAAWNALRHGTAGPDTLVCLGTLAALGWTVAALLLGPAGAPGATQPFRLLIERAEAGSATYLDVATAVTVLVLVGRYLQARAHAADLRLSDAERLARRVVVPFVLVLAVATLGFWLGTDAGAAAAFSAAVAVLLVGCPCALGLAAPTALLAGAVRGAQLGMLIKGPDVLESMQAVDTVVVDMTGTLTTGQMSVHRVVTDGVAAGEDGGSGGEPGGGSSS
ncbi:MAG TPA: HAD-IC family P-type ATPase, partial [Pseudonocardia sp.]